MILGVGIGLGFGRGIASQTNRLLALLRSGASQLIAHPLEYGTMFQDRAGTIPVTESGQLIGHCLDIGPGGYHATAISDSARGIFRDVVGKRRIEWNGVNTAYQTPVLPSPGVDKAQVFAGVRKAGDTAAILAELSATFGNGSFRVYSDANYNAITRGTTDSGRRTNGPSGANTSVISAALNNAGASDVLSVALRRNGATDSLALVGGGGAGGGNFNPSGADRLFYGARAGTSLFFSGHHYRTLGPIVRFGTNATPEQIAAAEAYYTAGLPA